MIVQKLHKPWYKTNHFKIGISYGAIAIIGISIFYFAKKDVNDKRVQQLKVKEEIKNSNKDIETSRFNKSFYTLTSDK